MMAGGSCADEVEARVQKMKWKPAADVQVWTPVAHDADLVAAALGETPLHLPTRDGVLAPFITINGRVHAPTSNFLRHHCMARPDLATAAASPPTSRAGWPT